MPWKIKRKFYLILLGCIAITLGLIVAIRDKNVDLKLLGIVAIVGGIAIILNLLTENGDNHNGSNGTNTRTGRRT